MLLATARPIAARLLELLDGSGRGIAVGSVAREKPEPTDIDLLLPLPLEGAQVDEVHERLEELVYVRGAAGGLFNQTPSRGPRQFFDVCLGFAPGFRHCRLHLDTTKPHASSWRDWRTDLAPFHVEVYRARVEPPSNWGWIQLVRTGPAEHGRAVVAWLKARGLRAEGGFLLDQHRKPIHTPTEQEAFAALGLHWKPPPLRSDHLTPARRRDAPPI